VSGHLAYVCDQGSTSVDEHHAIVDAIEKGHEDGAEGAVRANW